MIPGVLRHESFAFLRAWPPTKWPRDHSRFISLSVADQMDRFFFNGWIDGFGQAASESLKLDFDLVKGRELFGQTFSRRRLR